MSKTGDKFHNPITGEDAEVLVGSENSNNLAAISVLTVKPHGAVAGEHYHPSLEEAYTVLSGQVTFRLSGQEHSPAIGERVVVSAGTVHDWWNAGDTEARVLVEMRPPARMEEMIGELFLMAQNGQTDAKGLPQPIERLMAFGEKYKDVMVFTGPPPA